MSDVLAFADVGVRRGGTALLDGVDWEVEEGQRWVVLGPNGAGKTTLLQLAAGRIHPTSGVAGILGEVLGAVDVFELRPRIGLSSSALAAQIPDHESVRDVVVTASYGVVGRWRESYHELDHARADELLAALGAAHLSGRTFGTLFNPLVLYLHFPEGSDQPDSMLAEVQNTPWKEKHFYALPLEHDGGYVEVALGDARSGTTSVDAVLALLREGGVPAEVAAATLETIGGRRVGRIQLEIDPARTGDAVRLLEAAHLAPEVAA